MFSPQLPTIPTGGDPSFVEPPQCSPLVFRRYRLVATLPLSSHRRSGLHLHHRNGLPSASDDTHWWRPFLCRATADLSFIFTTAVHPLKKANKKAPTMRQLMEITYQKKTGGWSGTRVEKTLEAYNDLLASSRKDDAGASGDDMALWVKAAGGVKKGRVFGLGSHVSEIPPELLERYTFASGQATSQSPMVPRQVVDLEKLHAAMEEKMKNMQSDIMSNVDGVIDNLSAQLSSLVRQQSLPLQQLQFQPNSTPMQSFSQSMQAAMQQPTSSPANLSSLMSAADLNSSFSNLLNRTQWVCQCSGHT